MATAPAYGKREDPRALPATRTGCSGSNRWHVVLKRRLHLAAGILGQSKRKSACAGLLSDHIRSRVANRFPRCGCTRRRCATKPMGVARRTTSSCKPACWYPMEYKGAHDFPGLSVLADNGPDLSLRRSSVDTTLDFAWCSRRATTGATLLFLTEERPRDRARWFASRPPRRAFEAHTRVRLRRMDRATAAKVPAFEEPMQPVRIPSRRAVIELRLDFRW